MVKIILSVVYVALIFIAAGTIRWPELWFFIGFYILTTTAFMLWLKRHDPGLLKERMSGAKKENVKSWDKTIIGVYTGLLFIMFLVAPLDAVRFHWSHVPPALQWFAFSGILVSGIIVFRAFRVNPFLSGFVRIQTDRGHRVCAAGPIDSSGIPCTWRLFSLSFVCPFFSARSIPSSRPLSLPPSLSCGPASKIKPYGRSLSDMRITPPGCAGN